MTRLDSAMEQHHEGLMIKSLESPYIPGCRTDDWMKLKPDYVSEMGDRRDARR